MRAEYHFKKLPYDSTSKLHQSTDNKGGRTVHYATALVNCVKAQKGSVAPNAGAINVELRLLFLDFPIGVLCEAGVYMQKFLRFFGDRCWRWSKLCQSIQK